MKTTYPQLQSYVSETKISSLCVSCNTHNCPWLSDFKPVSNWKATSTSIRNEEGDVWETYKVLECPCYTQIPDFYGCQGDITRLVALRSGKTIAWVYRNKELVKRVWRVYSKKCLRSNVKLTEEKRNLIMQKIIEVISKKMKEERSLEKKRLKSLKNEK